VGVNHSPCTVQAPLEVEISGPTYVTAASYDIVLSSTGAVLGLVDEVVEQAKV
jgi:hypothetical protein